MASISKFSTALLSVPNEITLTAANFNLNFSLMKVEAPPEFHGLRDALSNPRRREAEEGLLHITARCLGALFESIIPPVPRLTVAYGKRVSELSGKMTPTAQPLGMFANRAGADGTSIWAAATSGQHAIAMHLLACILARIWKPAEAISLWVELVECRKQEILKSSDGATVTGISSIMAAQQPFNREQLSAWDASARSWLQTADATKRFDQTQLMLVINNVRMPVNNSKDPYQSVIAAWTSGMTTMERLIDGIPQRVQDGAILLSISSWHLYPNMQVLSDHTKDINPNDKLMSSSVLTVSTFGANEGRDGVFWSLPLSRMRYYSPPIVTERSLASDTSRITMEELQVVVLGALIAQWKRVCKDESRCCNIIIRLQEIYQGDSVGYPAWFELIARAASRFISSSGPLRAQYSKLLRLGGRRGIGFLHDPYLTTPAFFGLEYFPLLIQALANDEKRISFLRHAAISRNAKEDKVIIRYIKQDPVLGSIQKFASLVPRKRGSLKRSADQVETPSLGHYRIAVGRCLESEVSCYGPEGCGCTDPALEVCICTQKGSRCTVTCHPDLNMCCGADPSLPEECHNDDCSQSCPCLGCYNRILRSHTEDEGEDALLIPPDSLDLIDEYQFRLRRPSEKNMPTYALMFGSHDIAGVFHVKSAVTYDTHLKEVFDFPTATIDEIEAAVTSSSFDPSALDLDTCGGYWSGVGYEQTMESLKALVFASKVYASMPDSTVSIEVMNSPLYRCSWAKDMFDLPPTTQHWYMQQNEELDDAKLPLEHDGRLKSQYGLVVNSELGEGSPENIADNGSTLHSSPIENDENWMEARSNASQNSVDDLEYLDAVQLRQRSFACIAWLESGEFDIPIDHLKPVMALVNGDSIYVASALLADPSITTHNIPIRRVFGNLGRSEMCLLVPPKDPRIAEPDLRSWKQINHATFNGELQDCFRSTSLHLTFTDSEDTVYMGNRGLRDRQVVFLEALISIEDRGQNIGDLDILSMFGQSAFEIREECAHSKGEKAIFHPNDHLTAIDCWEEFLDPPSGTAVFRASGNWQARLGAAAAAVQLGRRVLVLPNEACLKCLGASHPNTNIIVA